jgi:hypothetical protein
LTSSFDILRKNRWGKPVVLAAVEDLETARLRLSQFASLKPGEYFVFNPRTQQIVAASMIPSGKLHEREAYLCRLVNESQPVGYIKRTRMRSVLQRRL